MRVKSYVVSLMTRVPFNILTFGGNGVGVGVGGGSSCGASGSGSGSGAALGAS